MANNQIKKFLFVGTAILFVMLICFSINFHSNNLLGVTFIKKDELNEYTYDETLKPTLLFNDVLAPIDYNTNTIYISQNIDELFSTQDLHGKFSVKENYVLKLVEDDRYNQLYDAMKNNYKFQLVALSKNTYTSFDVVFTSLPVICLDGEYIGNNEEGKASYKGDFRMFNSLANDNDGYRVESSYVDYHVRGATSALQKKKPYKLTLKSKKGNNSDLSLLGMGSDDDWILNPMSLDDLKVREKLSMDLWKQMSNDNSNNEIMSSGEYVEVIHNGKYQGIYLLQRRVDRKYLKLDDDILFKINNWSSFDKSAELVYSPVSNELSYLEDYTQIVNVENYIDMNIMIQVGSMYDNAFKNRYLLVKDINTQPEVKFILWDTDMSFGIGWKEGVFIYNFDNAIIANLNQRDYDSVLKTYPNLKQLESNRFNELSEHVLNPENIHSLIKQNYDSILLSGALDRDVNTFGYYYKGEDTIDKLYEFVEKRLNFLENYYSNR